MKHILFLVILAFSMSASAASVTEQFRLSQEIAVTATTTSTQVLPSNINRTYLLIQNNGAATLNVKVGSIQTAAEAILIAAGGSVEFKVAPTDSIWFKAAAGTLATVIIEGNAE